MVLSEVNTWAIASTSTRLYQPDTSLWLGNESISATNSASRLSLSNTPRNASITDSANSTG
ncbi:Uncharacterised protein [Vibrio cholerae]|nr:Uncharacterised protein [Vibrio cholerae]